MSTVNDKSTINSPCLHVVVSQLFLSRAPAICKASVKITVGNWTTSLMRNGNCYRFDPDSLQEHERIFSLIRLGWQELMGPPYENPIFSLDSSLKHLLPPPHPTERINGGNSAIPEYMKFLFLKALLSFFDSSTCQNFSVSKQKYIPNF